MNKIEIVNRPIKKTGNYPLLMFVFYNNDDLSSTCLIELSDTMRANNYQHFCYIPTNCFLVSFVINSIDGEFAEDIIQIVEIFTQIANKNKLTLVFDLGEALMTPPSEDIQGHIGEFVNTMLLKARNSCTSGRQSDND